MPGKVKGKLSDAKCGNFTYEEGIAAYRDAVKAGSKMKQATAGSPKGNIIIFGKDERSSYERSSKPTASRWMQKDYRRTLAKPRKSEDKSPWKSEANTTEANASRFKRRDKCGDFDMNAAARDYRNSLAERRSRGQEARKDLIFRQSSEEKNAEEHKKSSNAEVRKQENQGWNAEDYRIKRISAKQTKKTVNPFEGYTDSEGNPFARSFSRNTRCGDFEASAGLEAYRDGRKAAAKRRAGSDPANSAKFLISPRK